MKGEELNKVDLYSVDANGNKIKTFLMTKAFADNTQKSSPSTTTTKKDESSVNKQEGDLVYFDFNSTSLSNESKSIIKVVAEKLQKDKNQKVKLIGHTDNVSSAELNMRIGKDRANSVANYLKELGVSDSQIQIRSEGKGSPIVSNDTEEGRAKNRRVRIKLQ